MYNNQLYHHGVKGMKWGVRRYENKDGTLTPAGKRRYSDNQKNRIPTSPTKAAIKAGHETHKLATKVGMGTHKVATKAGLKTHKVATKAGLKTHKVATKAGLKTHKVATKAGLKTHEVATKIGVESFKTYRKVRRVTAKIALASLTAPISATAFLLNKGNKFVKSLETRKSTSKAQEDKGKRYVDSIMTSESEN